MSSVLVITLIGWCIRIIRQSTEDDEMWHHTLVVLRRTCGVLSERVKGLHLFHTRRVSDGDNVTLSDRQGEIRV
jgi:hypothetical protein